MLTIMNPGSRVIISLKKLDGAPTTLVSIFSMPPPSSDCIDSYIKGSSIEKLLFLPSTLKLITFVPVWPAVTSLANPREFMSLTILC